MTVEAYGQREPLVKVAQVTVKDAQTLNANVFDPSLVKAVAAAIQGAGLQLNPQIVGSAVKVSRSSCVGALISFGVFICLWSESFLCVNFGLRLTVSILQDSHSSRDE